MAPGQKNFRHNENMKHLVEVWIAEKLKETVRSFEPSSLKIVIFLQVGNCWGVIKRELSFG